MLGRAIGSNQAWQLFRERLSNLRKLVANPALRGIEVVNDDTRLRVSADFRRRRGRMFALHCTVVLK